MAGAGLSGPLGQLGDTFVQLFGAQTLSALTGANQTALSEAGSDPTQAISDYLSANAPTSNAAQSETTRKLATAKSVASAGGDTAGSLEILKTFLKGLAAGNS